MSGVVRARFLIRATAWSLVGAALLFFVLLAAAV